MITVFGYRRGELFSKAWFPVKAHVLGLLGVKEANCGGEQGFLRIASTLYGITLTKPEAFEASIFEIHRELMPMSKAQRKKLRKANIGKLEVLVNPPHRSLRNALAKSKAAAKAPKAPRLPRIKGKVFPSVEIKEAFYKSWEWRQLRMEVLKEHGPRCQCCGATPAHESMHGKAVRIVVDHIKPLSKFWELRLTRSNLQVLCDECNQGKGAWDETDWRETEVDPLTAEYQAVMGNPWGSA